MNMNTQKWVHEMQQYDRAWRTRRSCTLRLLQNSFTVLFKTVLWFSQLACLQAFTRKCKKHVTETGISLQWVVFASRLITQLSQCGNHAHRGCLALSSQPSRSGRPDFHMQLWCYYFRGGEKIRRERLHRLFQVQDWKLKLEPRALASGPDNIPLDRAVNWLVPVSRPPFRLKSW